MLCSMARYHLCVARLPTVLVGGAVDTAKIKKNPRGKTRGARALDALGQREGLGVL